MLSESPDATMTILSFTPDNPCDTTITCAADGSTLYRVTTELRKGGKVTNVYGSQGTVIASLEWRSTLPDKVKIKDDQPMSITGWLKKSSIPFNEYVPLRPFCSIAVSTSSEIYAVMSLLKTNGTASLLGDQLHLGVPWWYV